MFLRFWEAKAFWCLWSWGILPGDLRDAVNGDRDTAVITSEGLFGEWDSFYRYPERY